MNIIQPEQYGDITLFQGDCACVMEQIPDKSVDVVLTDPPYLYLKNKKLDVPFDEATVFDHWKRVLKPNGFVVMFGRGESFYRWNTMLAERGFKFKEEVVWDKGMCTSPLMNISRVHETISIFTLGKNGVLKNKIPYLEMKSNDIPGIIRDIKRLMTVFGNSKSMKAVSDFLKYNVVATTDKKDGRNVSVSSHIVSDDRCVAVAKIVSEGMNEKTIIRTDYDDCLRKNEGIVRRDAKTGDRCVNVIQGIQLGMNEKTIIKESRDHYSAIHPTQKPVRLLERLIQLVVKPFSDATVLDSFAGSMSTGEASHNLGLKCILIEKEREYYQSGRERIRTVTQNKRLL